MFEAKWSEHCRIFSSFLEIESSYLKNFFDIEFRLHNLFTVSRSKSSCLKVITVSVGFARKSRSGENELMKHKVEKDFKS